MKIELSKSRRDIQTKDMSEKLKSNTELMLNVVGGKEFIPMSNSNNQWRMPKQNHAFNFDILKTRRLIINDTSNESQQPSTTSCNYTFSLNSDDGPKQSQSQSCVVQFSNSFLARSTTKFNNSSISPTSLQTSRLSVKERTRQRRQYFNNLYSGLPKFFNDKPCKDENDDEVVCLDTSKADYSVTTVNSQDASFITIDGTNDTDETNNATISLVTPDGTPDLSKFEIVVRNTYCPDESNKNQEAADNLNDSVICIDSDNKEMEWDNEKSIQDQENNDIITIDDDNDKNVNLEYLSLPRRRLKIPKEKNKHSLISKKKVLSKKGNLTKHTAISTKKYITMLDPVCPVTKIRVTPPEDLQTSKFCSDIPTVSLNVLDDKASNMYNSEPILKNGLREIIIDGSNVALRHTNGISYSIEGLQIVVDYFVKRGHKVRAFVPQFRLIPGRSSNPELLRQLVKDKHVILTPSRAVNGRRITPYDDRFIIQYATLCEGIVVSSDCYRDLINEKPEWRNTIENRLLMPTWIDNILMFPEDPLGRFGPNLTDFLKFPTS